MSGPLVAHKFGGSSLATAERLTRVIDILLARDERQVVVVSAMHGVTDALIALVEEAAAREDWAPGVDALETRHHAVVDELVGAGGEALHARLRAEFDVLRQLLEAQALIGATSADLMGLVSGLGEVWSSMLVQALFEARGAPCQRLDAREVLVVERGEMGVMVDWDATGANLRERLPQPGPRVVVTGFVARTADGRITTLGRNGSDYSGAIFAALFEARELNIWTDVEGVLSADPRLVPEAVLIDRLSYAEACELAYFGAKVIHPQTMAPAFAHHIPIITRSTFKPEHPGTRIASEADLSVPVKGVTTFSGLAILNIEGAGLVGVPGAAERAFSALRQAGVSVVMISQGSSEHSICCVLHEGDAVAAERAVREAFSRELTAGLIGAVRLSHDVAALAVVGDGMAGTPGVAARLFSALGRVGVNVRVIAQGSSERNISVVVDQASARRALGAVHAAFYLSPQTLSIGVVGPGHVGRALLAQVHAARERLLGRSNVDLRVRAITGRSKMALGAPWLDLGDVRGLLDAGVAADLDAFTAHVDAEHLPNAVILDCSADDGIASRYESWLARGIHVITPNKQAGAGSWARYAAIKAQSRARFLYESTVGAGLPIITTLRDLIDTGDEVLRVDGIFSGTLAYLFNRFDGSEPFSKLVLEARALGYTEPDPRDDLSGLDVARKLVILARENGWKTSLSDVKLESLLPEALAGLSLEAFLADVRALDAPMLARLGAAKREGRVLRYVASLTADGAASVGLVSLPQSHAFAHLRLTDNVVQFTTRRYRDNPLVVQGPGAGPEVTAAGVFADLLRVATSLGARL